MIQRISLVLLALSLALFTECKKEKSIDEDKEVELLPAEGEQVVNGTIDVPDGVDRSKLSVVTFSGSYPIKDGGAFSALASTNEKQAVFVESAAGEILLVNVPGLGSTTVDARSTAASLVALMPWTAGVDMSVLKAFIDETAKTEAFSNLVSAIQTSVDAGSPPLGNPAVIDALGAWANGVGSNGDQVQRIAAQVPLPEVDGTWLVEPRLSFEDHTLKLENDGTTTATWGVEVSNSEGSVTGRLVLPGNSVKFPSMEGIWDAMGGKWLDAVFERAEGLDVPLPVDDKYRIVFAGPAALNGKRTPLADEAASYNIAMAYGAILNGFGLGELKLNYSFFFKEGCMDAWNNASTQAILDALDRGELTTGFFIGQAASFFEAGANTMVACAGKLFGEVDEKSIPIRKKYLLKLVEFLDGYSKLESIFVVSKLVGDLLMLADIDICRQVVEGGMYPCFSLALPDDMQKITVAPGEKVELRVDLIADNPEIKEKHHFQGATVSWSVTSGSGTLASGKSQAGSDGIAKNDFTPGEEEEQEVKAVILGPGGTVLDEVVFAMAVEESDIAGRWFIEKMIAYEYVNGTFVDTYRDDEFNPGAYFEFSADGTTFVNLMEEEGTTTGTYRLSDDGKRLSMDVDCDNCLISFDFDIQELSSQTMILRPLDKDEYTDEETDTRYSWTYDIHFKK